MCSSIRLFVETNDVDHANFVHMFRNQ
jgi:hypothetical protein